MRAPAEVVAAAEVVELPALGARRRRTSPAFGQRRAAAARVDRVRLVEDRRVAVEDGPPSPAIRSSAPSRRATTASSSREEDDLDGRLAVEPLASSRADGADVPSR